MIEEVVNNAMNQIGSSLDKISNSTKTINALSGDQTIATNALDLERSEHDLRENFRKMIMAGYVRRVPYSNELLPMLVGRALKKIRPFSEKKEEFRDAVIWLSCVEHIGSKKYSDVFLISNNISDFGDKNKQLHPDLYSDCPAVLYPTLNDFFNCEKDKLSKLIPSAVTEELMEWLSNNELDDFMIHDELHIRN